MITGSNFEKRTVKVGHARKVWRSIVNVFPGGGLITNFSAFVSAGCVPAGSPVKFDDSAKTIKVYTADDVKDAASAASASAFSSSATYAKGAYVTKSNKAYKCVTAITEAAAWNADNWTEVAVNVAALGINGFLQEQVDVNSATQKASGTVVYEGELYKYMFDADVVTALEYLSTTPKITWVR